MKVDYILCASGSVVVKQINIAIFADGEPDAKAQAMKMVESLCQGPYFSFDLFDVKKEGAHVRICGFTVEKPEPIVSIGRR